MNIWHKRIVYLQVLLLLFFIGVVICLPKGWHTYSVIGYVCFCLLEIWLLRVQDHESEHVALYRKSCLFALVDTLSVLVFMSAVLADLFSWIWTFPSYNPAWLIPLFLYIAVRKIYIMKNYSYEI